MHDESLLHEPGVPARLASDRARRIRSLRYDLTLEVPARPEAPVTGRLTAAFDLGEASRPLALDFAQPAGRIVAASAGGQPCTPDCSNGHVVIPESSLVEGHNTVTLDFVAGNEPLNRSAEYLYSLFVPARASWAIPCFDQPDLKARWRLSLVVDRTWTAVSNAPESSRAIEGERLAIAFDETDPLPPYLFAFAAGRFHVDTAVRNGRTFRMLHRETDTARLARNREPLYDLHARSLEWLEAYAAIAYPYAKFDFVLIPAFQFGGMEHPGAVYYDASRMLLDESATPDQQLARASLIAHETAHMWFGNLVTMRWFDDVWMKEVFANLFAARIVSPAFPDLDHDVRFLLDHYPAAYEVDRTAGAHPVRQELANLADAASLYGAIVYHKAPIAMRHLELLMGQDAFREAIRTYLATYGHRSATWQDLARLFAEYTTLDVTAWSKAWLGQRGRPVVRTNLRAEAGTITHLGFLPRPDEGRGGCPQHLRVTLGWIDAVRSFDVALTGQEAVVSGATGMESPSWVLPVGDGLGYGLFELDAASIAALTGGLHHVGPPITRAAALVALWEEMLEGHLEPRVLLDTLIVALPHESDELVLQHMLARAIALFWRFTRRDGRPVVAGTLEPVLRTGLDRSASKAVRAAWFNALRTVAITPATIAWLERIWRRDEIVDGLPMSESDETTLACELAIRGVGDAPEVVARQLARIRNPDRRARLAFIAPALSSDETVRDTFFAQLREPSARSREAWVVDAARYLHHPLRADASRRYVVPALDLLPEIQRTGDIFFPKRWADATLDGHADARVADDVRAYVDGLPGEYPERLRWILLSSADSLFRAARIVSAGP